MTEAQAILLVGGLMSVAYTALQIGDRLWGRRTTHSCRFDAQRLIDHDTRVDKSLERLADSQRTVLEAVKSIAVQAHHNLELDSLRHKEQMRSLDLIARGLDQQRKAS